MRKPLSWSAFALVAALAFAAVLVRLPYYSIGPGPAREVEPLIHVEGPERYPSAGRFVMTTIEYRQLTALGALLAWIDPDQRIVEESVLFPGGETHEEEQRRSISEMDQSKIDATSVALRELGIYPKRHGSGALIRGVVPGCSAEGELYPGDLIVSVNGEPIDDAPQAGRVIEAIPSGRALSFEVRPLGESTSEDVRLVRRPCGGEDRPLVGVSMTDSFPYDISIESGDVGGPSAGLMWALGLYDLLTPGDLTGGRTIAGTGVISAGGRVGPIGGIEEKVVAADHVGADILVVPKGNIEAARGVDAPGARLVPVRSFDDALAFLERD